MRAKLIMDRKKPVYIEILAWYFFIESMESIKLYSNRVFIPNRFGFVKYKPEVMIVCKVRLVGI